MCACCLAAAEFHLTTTLMKVMPTTRPLLGGDLLKASIDTISASTAHRTRKTSFRTEWMWATKSWSSSSQVTTWYVGELNLFGHRSRFLLQLLVSETHHLPFEGGRQQLLLPGLTQPIDVTLRREPAETVLYEGKQLQEHRAGRSRVHRAEFHRGWARSPALERAAMKLTDRSADVSSH